MTKLSRSKLSIICNLGVRAIFFLIGFSFLGYKFIRYSHNNYWQKTIWRVQTVDFNLLTHSLPTKISQALIDEEINELQRTLDSSYGYFGLVVTDCQNNNHNCEDQNILYSTETNNTWKLKLEESSKNVLLNSPYSILRNPPPLLTETEFSNARSEFPKSTGKSNDGEIIGRVYYIRGIPPELNSDIWIWFKRSWQDKWLSNSQAGGYYSLVLLTIILSTLFSVVLIEFILYIFRKRKNDKIDLQVKFEEQRRQWKDEENKTSAKIKKLKQELNKRELELQKQQESKQKLLEEKDEIENELTLKLNQKQEDIKQKEFQQSKLIERFNVEKNKRFSLEARISSLLEKSIKGEQHQQEILHLQQQLAHTKIRENSLQQSISDNQDFIVNLQTQIAFQKSIAKYKILEKEKIIAKSEIEIRKFQDRIKENNNSINKLKQQNQAYLEIIESDSKSIQQLKQANRIKHDEILNLRNKLKSSKQIHDRQQQELASYADEEIAKYKNNLDKNQIKLSGAIQKIKDLKILLVDYNELQKVCAVLEDKLFEYENTIKYKKDTKRTKRAVKFGEDKKLILVGGHKVSRRKVFEILCKQNDLHIYSEIPPSSEQRISRRSVRHKLQNGDLVVVVTGYIGHDLSNLVADSENIIRGDLIYSKFRGASGIIRKIEDHLIKKSLEK